MTSIEYTGDNLEKEVRKDPLVILYATLLRAKLYNMSSFDDVQYYTIIRMRNLLTEDTLKSNEVFQIIQSAFSSGCAYNFIRLLEEVELLKIIFPNIYALIKVDGGHYHNETVYSHVMGALRAVDKLNIPWFVKLSTLYHDCGKQKWEISEEGRRRFTNHATFGKDFVESDLRRLNFPEGVINTIKTLIGCHMSHINDNEQIHEHSLRKLKRNFDENNIPLKYFFWLRYTDNKGSAVIKTEFSYHWKIYRICLEVLNKKPEPSVKDLEVNGYDIMRNFGDNNGNRIEGKCIGYILKNLFNKWQKGEVENNYHDLLQEAVTLEQEWKNKYDFEKKYKK